MLLLHCLAQWQQYVTQKCAAVFCDQTCSPDVNNMVDINCLLTVDCVLQVGLVVRVPLVSGVMLAKWECLV